jgi:hypothetical protein
MSKRRPSKRAGAPASARPRTKKQAAKPIAPEAPKRGRGRPTTYDPAYCERVIELGEQGKSKAQIARALGCSRKALYAWMKAHEEFAEAIEEAQFASMAWWEDQGQAGLKMGSKFNASLFAYQMKNRFRDSYADKLDVAHAGKIEHEEPEMSNIELARRVAFALHLGMQEKQRREAEGMPLQLPQQPVNGWHRND